MNKGDILREIADKYLELNELFNQLALEVDDEEIEEEDDSE